MLGLLNTLQEFRFLAIVDGRVKFNSGPRPSRILGFSFCAALLKNGLDQNLVIP